MYWVIIFVVIVMIIWFASRGEVFIVDENTKGEKIMDFQVAGARHYSGKVKPMDNVLLIPELNNIYDENAIKILNLSRKQIGYVPKTHNKKVLKEMDRADVFGKVIAVYSRSSEIHVEILKHIPNKLS